MVTKVLLRGLACTLLKRRNMHFHHTYAILSTCDFYPALLIHGNRLVDAPSISFIFTGQGALFLQMG